jgi:hypothetical protein
MAARRDRERRRPAAERRYRFATPETSLEPDDALLAEDGEATAAAADGGAAKAPPKRARATAREATGSSVRGGARVAAQPFSAYAAEYSYVVGDLRRVAIVIGSLLLILLLLYFFVVPR